MTKRYAILNGKFVDPFNGNEISMYHMVNERVREKHADQIKKVQELGVKASNIKADLDNIRKLGNVFITVDAEIAMNELLATLEKKSEYAKADYNDAGKELESIKHEIMQELHGELVAERERIEQQQNNIKRQQLEAELAALEEK